MTRPVRDLLAFAAAVAAICAGTGCTSLFDDPAQYRHDLESELPHHLEPVLGPLDATAPGGRPGSDVNRSAPPTGNPDARRPDNATDAPTH